MKKNIFLQTLLLFSLVSCTRYYDYKIKIDSNGKDIVAQSEYKFKEKETVVIAFTLDKNNNPYPGLSPMINTSIPIKKDTILSYKDEDGKEKTYLFMNGKISGDAN